MYIYTHIYAPPHVPQDERIAYTASYFVDGATRLPVGATPADEDGESWGDWAADVRPGQPARHDLLSLVWPLSGSVSLNMYICIYLYISVYISIF